ncbi:DUF5997 family protein [Lacisediminihabitans sp.]|jgi:hypothetical protein|uniref:DUF5997 family protein n=1 Tax=Lacisediminihabitans sp. TaxID=2787631 RepID=UPI002F95D3CE
MTSAQSNQTMKPATAAQKLGIYLPATPESFQQSTVSRAELNELIANPPAWLVELRKTGPHPRPEVARKLGVSIAGLARGEVTEPLTTDEISALLKQPPAWLVRERAVHAEVQDENARVKSLHAHQRLLAENRSTAEKKDAEKKDTKKKDPKKAQDGPSRDTRTR